MGKNIGEMELAPFPLEVPDQSYVLVSFVAPEAPQATDVSGFRVYGAFATLEAAKAHAARVNAVDPAFDVYVAEMYRWCAWHPDPQQIADKVHSDKQLDTLLREYRAQQEAAREMFDRRIADDIARGAARPEGAPEAAGHEAAGHEGASPEPEAEP
jgi:hypothetical protein